MTQVKKEISKAVRHAYALQTPASGVDMAELMDMARADREAAGVTGDNGSELQFENGPDSIYAYWIEETEIGDESIFGGPQVEVLARALVESGNGDWNSLSEMVKENVRIKAQNVIKEMIAAER